VLLEELEHRVANSLQIIASIIMLKGKSSGVGRNNDAICKMLTTGSFR